MIRNALLLAPLVAAAACTTTDPFLEGQIAYSRGDLVTAHDSLRVAAESGNGKAARVLCTMVGDGVTVTGGQKLDPRPDEAARWCEQAAADGDRQAAKRLGFMRTYGRGVPVDYVEAVRLLGPPTAEMQEGVRKYSAEEQAEIEAWMLSLSFRMAARSDALRRDFSSGAHVDVVLHAKDERVSVESPTQAPEHVQLAVVDAAKAALRDAPPTPAAARRQATAHFTFEFRYRD